MLSLNNGGVIKENKKDIYIYIINNNNKIKKDRRNKYGKK